jgi:hypothetical protein
VIGTPDLTPEEWEALQRVHRGAPEATLVPASIFERLVEVGFAYERAGARKVSERGRALILRRRDRKYG